MEWWQQYIAIKLFLPAWNCLGQQAKRRVIFFQQPSVCLSVLEMCVLLFYWPLSCDLPDFQIPQLEYPNPPPTWDLKTCWYFSQGFVSSCCCECLIFVVISEITNSWSLVFSVCCGTILWYPRSPRSLQFLPSIFCTVVPDPYLLNRW